MSLRGVDNYLDYFVNRRFILEALWWRC